MSSERIALPSTHAAIQELFDDAVSNAIAPGFQFVVFNRDEIVLNGVSGYARLPETTSPSALANHASDSDSDQPPASSLPGSLDPIHLASDMSPDGDVEKVDRRFEGEKMTAAHVHWIASCGKLAVSLLALIILERGLADNYPTNDQSLIDVATLDDHAKLVEVLPEFKLGGESLVTKVIEGWEEVEEDGAENGNEITEGQNQPQYVSDKQGRRIPRLREAKTGVTLHWLGQWIVRSTGRNLRELLATYIFEPLGIPSSECDSAITEAISEHLLVPYSKTGDPSNPFKVNPRSLYNCLGTPPPGYAHFASAPIISSTQAYCKLLQAVLRHDKRLLREESSWVFAEGDALGKMGIRLPVPRVPSVLPWMACELERFSTHIETETGTDSPETPMSSVNLLNTELALKPTTTGRPVGSYAWCGSVNSYYAIDPINGFGYMWSAQCAPFAHPDFLGLKDEFEKIVYGAFEAEEASG
ncbi:beta-lactamase/transpeptidase-like protein [Clavulina sp. PMI_390]|nr:beta-lactamase/transpeptidase-like protein [Clavulina sp. PMI_390]